MAYVVILHLSPEHDSILADVLQSSAAIPVTQVQEEQVKVEPDHVYVIPPNQSLRMFDGYLELSNVTRIEERRAPVDIFFRTLAESHDSRAVGVILSGTGANGSMGIKRIKEKGGVVIVQDPNEAEYNDMPRNSLATGLVDFSLPAAEIPSRIITYCNQLGKVQIAVDPDAPAETDEQALRDILTQLRMRTGHDFSNYKRATVLRRIERRMNVNELTDLPSYARLMREQSPEASALLRDLLISVTNFFRDSETFVALEHHIIAQLFENKTANDTVRVWVAGCATGEEAYSLAMLLSEHAGSLIEPPKIQIFATDIDETAIFIAREGFFTETDVADISPERLRHFFVKETNGYRVRRELREKILFAVHNVIKDPPFSHLDLASCRNLLIYLNRTAQKRVVEVMHFALNAGGFLFLGTSESAENAGELFAVFDKQHHIYQSRNVNARASLPVGEFSPPLLNVPPTQVTERRISEANALERLAYADLHQRLLEQFAPPSIVVNENYDILHLSEHAGKYLEVAGGEPSYNLLKIVRPEVRLELRTALYQAIEKRTSVETGNLQLQTGERRQTINIIVRPVLREGDTTRGFLLVLFEEIAETADENRAQTEIVSIDQPAQMLETELGQARSQLTTAINQYEIQTEELRASNEELQAMNEELRSATEELETGKEELQSINEELQTVNQELKIKIEELSQSNDDFQNLMASTDIGTLFLDRSLRVKFFTPRLLELFNLIPTDIGRPLSDITGKIVNADLLTEAETVAARLQRVEREVWTTEERCYLMRVLPYRTTENRIEGVTVTFLEITHRKQQEEELRTSETMLSLVRESESIVSLIYNNSPDVLFLLKVEPDEQYRFVSVNEKFLNVTGYTREQVENAPMEKVIPVDNIPLVRSKYNRVVETKKPLTYEETAKLPAGLRYGEITLTPIFAPDGSIPHILAAVKNVTERKLAENALRESEAQMRLIIESISDYAIFTVSPEGIINSWNTGAEKVFGFSESEALGQPGAIIFTPEDRRNGVPDQEMKTALEKGAAPDERFHMRKDGSRFYVSGVMNLVKDDIGKVRGFVKIARDMTDRVKAEQILHEKAMLQKVIGVLEDERLRIARDLHDELGQQLTALRLKLENTKEMCEDSEICERIDEIQLIAKNIDSNVDFLAWELRPAALDDLGLIAALEKYIREWSAHSGVPVDYRFSKLVENWVNSDSEINLYRITQEALNNVYKHSGAKRVNMLLERRDGSAVLIIEDDGIGFNLKNTKNKYKCIGLIGMQERAALIGGSFEIETAPGKGTTVFVRVPISPDETENGNE